MQLIKIIGIALLATFITGCAIEQATQVPTIATDVTLYSEFPQQESILHQKLHNYFNLKCKNGSSMSVVTPLHLTEDGFAENTPSSKAHYKIVIGNNIFGNTVYYSNPKTEKLAHNISTVLNDFLANYDLEFSNSINNVLPFNAHYLDHSSYLSKLANDPTDAATTFKIGIDHSLPLEDKTQLVVNLVVYLAKTLGSDCLQAIPKSSDLQFSMKDCQCPSDGKGELKSYESSTDWMM
jgi:hypothetical protein